VAVGSAAFDTSTSLTGGVVTRRGGDVHVMADGNIDLYTSRVFTLQGGSITMWTSEGSITAGSGSKTSVTDVPLSYAMTNDGVVSVNVFGLQTGAGIGVLDALQGADSNRPRSRIDLIAPFGEVNAGDAGIRVVGDLNIAAQTVVGLENIQVTGGTARGVPQVEAPNLALTTTADALTATATQAGVGPSPEAARRAIAELPSIITVEVVGYEAKKRPGDEPAATP
jgi:filamentous hemagglutinin